MLPETDKPIGFGFNKYPTKKEINECIREIYPEQVVDVYIEKKVCVKGVCKLYIKNGRKFVEERTAFD